MIVVQVGNKELRKRGNCNVLIMNSGHSTKNAKNVKSLEYIMSNRNSNYSIVVKYYSTGVDRLIIIFISLQ